MVRLRPIFATLLLAVPAVCAAQSQAADKQKPSPGTKPGDSIPQSDLVLRLEVRRVPVDVVVLDRDGNPVRGLKPEDFTVKEDRKPQRILTFDYLDGTVPSYVPPAVPPLPANTYINVPAEPERGPLYVLYYDMVNTEPEDQMIFRKELLRFVDGAQPGTRIAVFVNASGLHLLQGFTSDRAQLRNAILAKGPGVHIPDVFLSGLTFGRQDMGAAISNLQFMAEYLFGIPGRKNLVWLAGKFPLPHGPVFRPVAGDEVHEIARQSAIRYAFAAMMRAQVAVSPVDIKGVELWEERSPSPAGDAGPDFSMFDGHGSATAPPPPGSGADGGGNSNGGSKTNNGQGQSTSSADTVSPDHGLTTGLAGFSVTYVDQNQEEYIANSTGGHAYFGSNGISAAMNKAIETGESYYTLTYAPTNGIDDGSERNIEVSVAGQKEKGYRLTYRNLYYAMSDKAVQDMHKQDTPQARFIAAKTADTLYANIEHGAPMLHDLLFSAHLSPDGHPRMATAEQMMQLSDSPAYFKTHGRNSSPRAPTPVPLQRYLIDYGVIDPQLKPLAARSGKPAVLEFAAAAYDADGRMLNSILNEGLVAGETQPGARSGSLFHAVQELEVPEGASWIRLAVRDKLDKRSGTLEVHLPLKLETSSTVASKAN